MASASDVPSKFDIVIGGEGYLSADVEQVEAEYGFTPTFLPRQNFSRVYGDNFYDFWVSIAQTDWSLGEQQKFFRVEDEESRRRYWAGENVDVSTPGEVRMHGAGSVGFGSVAAESATGSSDGTYSAYVATSTNLFGVAGSGGHTDRKSVV